MKLYTLDWPTDDPARVEMAMIQKGGKFQSNGRWVGEGLLHHYLQLRKHLWPKRYENRWNRLIYEEILKNDVTVLAGCSSSSKSSTGAEYILTDYFTFPENTLSIVSTTTVQKLESAIWGEIKKLFMDAVAIRDWLPGNLIDHMKIIATDDVGEGEVRDMRKGIRGLACYSSQNKSGRSGLSVFVGIKQERLRFFGDELQFMESTFLDAWPNLFSNPNVKIIGSGNYKHDPDDPLCVASEPKAGWESVQDISKTTVWDNVFMNSRTVNLIGLDSPNFDVPEGQPEPYPRLIGRKYVEKIEEAYGKNTPIYESFVYGRMRLSMTQQHVITREICRQHKALEPAVWLNEDRTRVKAVDPSYGGRDECQICTIDFGTGIDGNQIMQLVSMRKIIIDLSKKESSEDQIAMEVKRDLESEDVPASQCFYDSFGRGTLGFSFARVFGKDCPVPVDAGGKTTERPVRAGLYIDDPKTGQKRLKKCSEHYSKFVSEMWFSVRLIIEAEQFRELDTLTMVEGCQRLYSTVAGNKLEIEPKPDLIERVKKSPNRFDALAIAVEGCRRSGFVIRGLGKDVPQKKNNPYWLDKLAKEQHELVKSRQLQHV